MLSRWPVLVGQVAFLTGLSTAVAQDKAEDADDPFGAIPDEMRLQIEAELLKANARVRVQGRQIPGNLRLNFNAQALQLVDPAGGSDEESTSIEGASVKTDSEMESLLSRAGDFAKDGRYDLSALLWQEVVDRSGDIVFTKDEWIRNTLLHKYQRYRGITSEIERTLAALPAEGLEAYRVKADGEARGILRAGGESGREAALGEIVRRYFLSSIGDDAAFELACLKLDRFEFLPAARLLSKVLREYPDSSIAREEILIRLAAASGRLGDVSGARELLGEAARLKKVSAAVLAQVGDYVDEAARGDGAMLAGGRGDGTEWRMTGGNASRSGTMAALPETFMRAGGALSMDWQQAFKLNLPENWPTEPNFELDPYELSAMAPSITGIRFGNAIDDSEDEGEKVEAPTMEEKWRGGDWMPTGQMLLAGDSVFFKTHYQIVCLEAGTGAPKWLGFRNIFPLDSVSNIAGMYRGNLPDTGAPTTMEEVELFADNVHQGMCLAGDILVTLEGQLSDFAEEGKNDAQRLNNGMGRFRMGFDGRANRARSNRLVAYHAKSGKLRWSRYEGDGLFADGDGVTFAGSPVPYGSLLLVPVNIDGAIWLQALSLTTGETLWKSFLATEPGSSCSPYSPVTVAVEGGDAYVASGAGLVFSLDAVSGALNWATRYARSARTSGLDDRNRAWMGRMQNPVHTLDGWQQDYVIPHGSALVFAGSDFDQLAAFDRRSGELLWESPRVPFEGGAASTYILGTSNGNVYVAGPEVVRCYRIEGGRFLWETKIERSFAHGMLTENALYVPLADSIARLSLETGEITRQFPVKAEASEPVGNLFSDGKRIFSFGLRRIYTLVPGADVPGDVPPVPEPPAAAPNPPTGKSGPESAAEPSTNIPS